MGALCTRILQSEGSHALNSAEDLLILFIVAVAPRPYAPFDNLCAYLWAINPASPSALDLGSLYCESGLYGEAATVLSWGLDYFSHRPKASFVKCLLRCFQKLQLMDEDCFDDLIGELEKTSFYKSTRKGRVAIATGAWAVVKDVRFKDCQQIV